MKRPKTAVSFTGTPARRDADADDDDADLVLAQRVRACYARERGRWESIRAGRPVPYRVPAAYDGRPALCVDGDPDAVVEPAKDGVWLRLVAWCRARDIPPEAYVELLFEVASPLDRMAPEPNNLKSARSLELWTTYAPRVAARIRARLYTERDLAETWYAVEHDSERTSQQAWAAVLCKSALELSPLFRYCVAQRIGGKRFARIAAYYEVGAVLQFERHRAAYLEHWAGLLPRDFPERSKALYPQLLAR